MAEQSKSIAGTYGDNFGEAFQWHLLAVSARTPSALIRFRSAFDHTYFSSDVQRVIAKSLLAHVDKYHTLPTKTLLIEESKLNASKDLTEKIEKSVAAMYLEDVSDAKATLDKAVEFGKLQAMCNAVLAGADQLDKGDRSGIMQLVQTASHVGDDVLDLGIDFKKADRTKWYGTQAEEERIPTGIAHLDRALGGGGLRGALYLFLAPPKRGKTVCLVNVGFGALIDPDGFTVVHITNEISAKRTSMRYDARLAGKFFHLRKTDPDKYAHLMSERANLYLHGRLFVKGWPTRMCAPSNIRSYLSMLGGEGIKPDRLVIDYADIMRPERRIGDMRHEQAGIYEDLRGIGGEYNCDVWTASQAKQSALEKETPDMRDFAESFEKAAIMDGGFAICQTADEQIDGRARLFAMGMRDEQDKSTIEMKMDNSRCFIRSTGLFDLALNRIPTPEDDPDLEDMTAKPVGGVKKDSDKKQGGYGKSGGVKKEKIFGKAVPAASNTPIVPPAAQTPKVAAPTPPPAKAPVKMPVLKVAAPVKTPVLKTPAPAVVSKKIAVKKG